MNVSACLCQILHFIISLYICIKVFWEKAQKKNLIEMHKKILES